MKPMYKKFLFVFLIALGIYVFAIIAVVANSEYKKFKEKRAVQKWEEALRKPYKEDVYGGKTPEETWNMFLDALKKGDIELASKYFAVEKQKEWRNTIESTLKAGKLNFVIKNLSTELKRENDYLKDNKAYYYYELKDDEPGEFYNNAVVFYLNPYTRIWKILVL